MARLSLLIHSCLPPAPVPQFGYHLHPLAKTSNTDSFWEPQSPAFLLPATEFSSRLQSHDKFRLPCMVCDFVIYISYGCSSHTDDFHFTFSKIHRVKLCPFLPREGKVDPSTLQPGAVGKGGERRGKGGEKRKVFTLQSC